MLALEPAAQIFSSTGANPGIPEIGRFAVGELDLEAWISQAVFYEQFDFTKIFGRTFDVLDRIDDLFRLRIWFTDALVDELIQRGFLQSSPPSGFAVKRKLHIAYPADPKQPAKLAGSGRLPLAVLLHGNHGYYDLINNRPVPNHRGYIYLQQELASWGIVSVSVDTNVANAFGQQNEMRAEMTLGALDTIRAMDADTTSPFYQRIDFQNVGMMGHSRGGDAVVRAAILNAARPAATRYAIKAICSVAPTDITGSTTLPNRLDSSMASFYSVIYGALDGDVSGAKIDVFDSFGTGFRHYDRASTDKSMVFFEACNHNRFNDVWPDDDPNTLAADLKRPVFRQDHQNLLKEYVGGLFRWQLLDAQTPKDLFDGTAANSVGAKAAIQWSFGQKIDHLDELENATMPEIGSRALSGGASIGDMAKVTIGTIKVREYTNHQTGVLIVKPDPTAIRYKLDIPPAYQNWNNYDLFTFRVCADADVTSPATIADPAKSPLPDFTLVFKDSTTGIAQVTAASLRTPNRPRLPVFHTAYWKTEHRSALDPNIIITDQGIENCSVIRLETLAVDLAGLAGVDRAHIASVAVNVPPAFTKYQFFDSFQLIKR